MKKAIIFYLLLLSGATLNAQDWQLDFAKAKALAQQEKKPIIMVFQGSDWCAPCIKLDRQIWSSEPFKSFAQKHAILLKVDFPKRKKNELPAEQKIHNQKLAGKYNQNGYFPYVVVVDATGQVQGSTGYKNSTPEEYINLLKKMYQ